MKKLVLLLAGVFVLSTAALAAKPAPVQPMNPGHGDLQEKIRNLAYQFESTLNDIAAAAQDDVGFYPPGGGGGGGLCNWEGHRWISHGWDGACAWQTGVWIECRGNRIARIDWEQGCNPAKVK